MEKKDYGVAVKLLRPFAVVRETLERIGIGSRKEKKIYPSCYIKTVDGKVKLYHFKELLQVPKMDEMDIMRKNTIIWLLSNWNLIKVFDETIFKNISPKNVFILSRKEKTDWEVVHKFHYEGFEPKITNKKTERQSYMDTYDSKERKIGV
jgi:hypothetical protein